MKLRWRKNSSASRTVPRLTHRQPLPRSFFGKVAHFVRYVRYFPLAFAAAVILMALGFGFVRYVVHSPYFSLEVIQIDGNDRVSRPAVLAFLRERMGIEPGTSTLGIRAAKVAAELDSIPEILVTTVEKRWPNGLFIEITERRPSGIYVSRNASFVFDRDGYLFSAVRGGDLSRLDLPVLTGLDKSDLQRGGRIPPRMLELAWNYRQICSQAAPSLAQSISEYNCDSEAGLTLVLDDGVRVLCGFRPPEKTGPVIEAMLANPVVGHRLETANLFSDLYVSVTRRGMDIPAGTAVKR